MIGKAVWDWICSAPKRPYIQRSYDELVALVSSANTADTKTLGLIRKELEYRKRLRGSKKEKLIELIEIKANFAQEAQGKAENHGHEEISKVEENQQNTDQSKKHEEYSDTGNIENILEQDEGAGKSEERGECKPDKQEPEDVRKNIHIENIRTSERQLDVTEEAKVTDDKEEFDDIYKLEISRKTYNALRRNGLKDIARLRYMSDEEILMLKGVGQKALDEIREAFPKTKEVDNNQSVIEHKTFTHKEAIRRNGQHNKNTESESGEAVKGKERKKEEPAEKREYADLRDLLMFDTFSAYRDEITCLNEAIDPARKHLCMVSAINHEHEFSFLLKRMRGMTLESIGEEAGITRERVRQVIKKASQRVGIETGEIYNMLEKKRKESDELKIVERIDSDLLDRQMISEATRNEWRKVKGREMSLRDRIDMLQNFFVPIPANELQDHLTIIEEGKGQYGGTEYWDDIVILRLLVNMIALNNGKPGVMPRQIEIPRLVSRYIQKRGGQRQVAQILGISYEGPIGSRNRNYWTDRKISQAIKETQKYFGLPEDTMPEQAQITVWLDLDGDDDTKGPSCIAAIKKQGGWKHYCDEKGYKQYIDQDDDGKKEIDSSILLNLWNRNGFITKESEFMDVFTEFLGEFWNSQSDPRRYISLVNNACKVAKSIAEHSGIIDNKQREEIVCKAVEMDPALDAQQPEDKHSDSLNVDRFVDLLF